jgi:site-specific recombinase XerD
VLSDFTDHLVGQDLAGRTVAAYTDHVRLFAAWFELTNGQPLDKTNITQTDVREFKQHLVQRGAAPATINTKLAALKSFATWCGISFQVSGIEQQPLAPRWLDRRQRAALLREAELAINAAKFNTRRGLAIHNRAIIVLLLNTGLRVSELCTLQPADVIAGQRSGTVTVNGKGSKVRTVALNKEARAALQAITLPLQLKPRQVERIIAELGRRAGVQATPHVLRHTFAKSLIDSGVPADRVAALLGHDDLDTTRRYTTPGQQDLQAAVETLE